MRMIAGLGNPGTEYEGTRHNIGVAAIEHIAAKYALKPDQEGALSARRRGTIAGLPVLTVRPLVYMNDSGRALSAALEASNATAILVIHDDVSLQLGQVRVKFGGKDAGHNGIKSIDSAIGNEYWRVRLGVGHPGASSAVVEHVLGQFGESEQTPVEKLLNCLADALPLHLAGNTEAFK